MYDFIIHFDFVIFHRLCRSQLKECFFILIRSILCSGLFLRINIIAMKQVRSDLTAVIDCTLRDKYQHNFSFYRVRAINEMLYGHFSSSTYLDLCEARTYSDDAEYLRRIYYLLSPTGREELMPRIKMCCGMI